MPPIIPISQHFDQPTLSKMIDADAIVQRYRTLFALFDWSDIDAPARRGPGKPAHPHSAYLKAALVRINEQLGSTPRWRCYLLDHPLLVLELGFRPHVDTRQPYGFDVATTVPSVRWLNHWLRDVDRRLLATLFEQTVQALCAEIPGLGEVVAYDVKHLYAHVKENNPRVSLKDRFCKDRQPKGDRDCKVGVKKSTNLELPDGSKKVVKEYLWGYGSGVAAATVPDYGTAVLAEDTHPFNENEVEHFPPLFLQTIALLGTFPLHISADAAFDAWYVYQGCACRRGMAAIPRNQHAHPIFVRDADGTPRCPAGLRRHPTYQFAHTNGYRAQRYRCPLLYPVRTGQSCDHEQFTTGKGCVKDCNIEAGGLMRVTLDRDGPLYKAIYTQRTGHANASTVRPRTWGTLRPKARNIRSIRRLNTMIYITINAKLLQKARAINASLLSPALGKIA